MICPEGTVQSWNAGGERLEGYTADEAISENFARFFSPADQAARKPRALLAEARRAGRAEDLGWRIRKDDSQFWASAVITALRDAAGRHIGFTKVTQDLTDRSYRAFVEAAHAIGWTVDSLGVPTADSPSWRAFTGQSEAPWRGATRWDPVYPDDFSRLRAAWDAVTLSAAEPVGAEPGGPDATAPDRGPQPLRGVHVLLVEDDDDAREMMGDALALQGASVERAASAAEAFASVLRGPPHVMVSDIGMPGEDGYSLLRRIRALPPQQGGEIPAIAVTAYARPDDIRRAQEAGFQLHLVKPVRFEQLVRAVSSLVG